MDAKVTQVIAEAVRQAQLMDNDSLKSKAAMSELEARPVRWQAQLDQALAGGDLDHIGHAAWQLEHVKRQLAYAKATR